MTGVTEPAHDKVPDNHAGGVWLRLRSRLARPSLRAVLILSFTALVIGSAGVVGALSYHAGREAVEILAQRLLSEISARVDQRLGRYLLEPNSAIDADIALLAEGKLRLDDPEALARHFALQLTQFEGVAGFGAVTEQRQMLMVIRNQQDSLFVRRFDKSTGERLNRYSADLKGNTLGLIDSRTGFDPHNDPPGKPWYAEVRAYESAGWSMSVSLARGQDHPTLISHYGRPVKGPDGKILGVLVASMTLTGLSDFLRDLPISTRGQVFLMDRDGLMVATSTGEVPFDARARADHAQNVAVAPRRLAATSSGNQMTRDAALRLNEIEPDLRKLSAPLSYVFKYNGERYLAHVVPSALEIRHPDWLLVTLAPVADFTALIAANLHEPILLGGVVLIIAVLLGWIAAAVISRPLADLNRATHSLAEGAFDHRIPRSGILELRELGLSFSRMAQRLQSAFAELQSVNQTLRTAEGELAKQNQLLEKRVEERTSELIATQEHLLAANEELARLASIDQLTGIWNRRHFETIAAMEIARARRDHEPISIAMLDIDHFKRVNDRYGHLVGDRVLIDVCGTVRRQLRATDFFARWGGEEFVILMPNCEIADAFRRADDLRKRISNENALEEISVTASFGIAGLQPADTLSSWINRVDEALYAAKANGRNQVRTVG